MDESHPPCYAYSVAQKSYCSINTRAPTTTHDYNEWWSGCLLDRLVQSVLSWITSSQFKWTFCVLWPSIGPSTNPFIV
jgi:hypothetical protein